MDELGATRSKEYKTEIKGIWMEWPRNLGKSNPEALRQESRTMKQQISKQQFQQWLAKNQLLIKQTVSEGPFGRTINYHRVMDDKVVMTAHRGTDPGTAMSYHMVDGGKVTAGE